MAPGAGTLYDVHCPRITIEGAGRGMRTPSLDTALAILVLALAVGLRVADPEPIARLRLSIFDTYQRLAPRTPDPAAGVRVVDIDEASLARIGQWPWPRDRLAELVDRIRSRGARTVSIDLVLAEPDRVSAEALARAFAGEPALAPLLDRARTLPSNDDKLAVALSRLPVVLGVSAETRQKGEAPPPKAAFAAAGDAIERAIPRFGGSAAPLAILADRAAGLGAVNWIPSGDQIVRRVPLLLDIAGRLYPSLSLEQLRLAEKTSTFLVRSSGASGMTAFGQSSGVDSVVVGTRLLPTEGNGEMWLHFAPFRPAGYIPAHAVLDGTDPEGALKDAHVVIGTSATGLLDLRATPLDASVPGIEIHAQALEQMLSGDHLVRPSWATGAEIAFLALLGGLTAWLISALGPLAAAGLAAAATVAFALASWLAYGAGYLFDPVYPGIAVVAAYLLLSLEKYVRSEAERSRIRMAFSHYVAAPVVEELALHPEKLKLGGEMREVTVLFADARGFSKLSEGMPAEDLVTLVNELFTPLSEVILDARGTIDKYMGDAVMAFWNAPLDDPDHARSACRAALGMMAALGDLNRAWQAAAAARGETHAPIRMGIGLNTGKCSVGNFGSSKQFNYSIMGEAVNVASRLQELTKTMGTPVIVGEETARAASGFAFVEIGTITPRGKTRPERIFALAGDDALRGSEAFRSFTADHAALLAALAVKDLSTARERLAACRRQGATFASGLLEHYAAELARSA